MPRADSQPGTARGPRRFLLTEALHPRSLPTRALPFAASTAPSRRGGGGRGYEPGPGEHTPRSASAGGRTPPRAPFPPHRRAPRRAAAQPSPAHSAPRPRPAATRPRPRVGSCASRLPIGCAVPIGRDPASEARAGGAGAEEGALPASFVTSRGQTLPIGSRPARAPDATPRGQGKERLRAPPPPIPQR